MKGWILACTIAQSPASLLPPAFPVQAAMLVSDVPVTPVRLLTFSVVKTVHMLPDLFWSPFHVLLQELVLVVYAWLVTLEPGD